MERFNRMLQAAQGMGMSNSAPGAVRSFPVLQHSPFPVTKQYSCLYSAPKASDLLHITALDRTLAQDTKPLTDKNGDSGYTQPRR